MRLASLVLAAFAILGQQRPTGDDLSAAKALYASGAYEEALTKLSSVPSSDGNAVDTANEYRALCYLALGRTPEASRQIDELIVRSPLFKMSENEVPPRLIAMFHEERKKLLPGVARGAYITAKASYEQKQYPVAQRQLRDVLQILADDDLAEDASGTADIKLFAEGFLKLADMEIANAQKAAADAAEKAAAANKPPPPPPPDPIFSVADKDVKPPVEISKKMPEWNPPSQAAQKMEFRGVLRVLVDKKGAVEFASVAQAIAPNYDPLLVEAAKQWTFKPATKDGQPVRYQLLIQVVLSPK
jgi:tetratricopeptide (TPR) repeat protein